MTNLVLLTLMNIGIFVAFTIATTIIHEIGHILLLKKYTGRNIRLYFKKGKQNRSIQCGTPKDYEGLTDTQYNRVVFAGIALGIVPIAIYASIGTLQWYTSPFLAFIYMWGCRADLKILIASMREELDQGAHS